LIYETGYSRHLEFLIVGEDVPPGALSVDEVLNQPLNLERAEAALQRSRLGPLDTCQIATTSGSTGVPKCVEVRIYARLLTGSIQVRRFGIGPQDTIAPLGPIISGTSETLGYFGAALLGLRVVLCGHFDAEEALELFSRERVSFACVVPTMLAKMASHAERLKASKTLRGLASYGSVLPLSLAERIERASGVKVVQGYGTADYGGIAATFFDSDIHSRVATVGRPLEGNEVQVCGDRGEPLPVGETGHIRVCGLHAVGGYYKSPEFDAERWRDGYFDVREIGRFDRQGNLVVLGRSDDVIIRAGHNIYPEDVEALLLRHPSIQEASVVGIPDPTYGQKVCAFVLLRPGHQISLSEMTDFLRKAGLAQFKLPEMLEILPDLPKVPTEQKVDRKELVRIAKRRLAID
jgi:acyl-CoA synthetase (AMP-forming)/AMP-acid ligase II